MLKKILERLCQKIERDSHPVTLNGVRVKLPYLSGILVEISEPWMKSVLSRLFRHGEGLFIDVGVNLGQTLLQVKTLEPDRPYIGFEPNPNCCFYVNRLIEYNSLQDTVIVPVGLAEESGLGVLHSIQDCCHDSAGSIVEGFREESRVQRKSFVPLYDLKQGVAVLPEEKVAVIKIDVEGAESLVLTALWDVITAQRPIIVMELLPPHDEESVRFEQQLKIYQNFQRIDYDLCRIIKQANNEVIFSRLDQYEPYSEIELSDYVVIPKEKSEGLVTLSKPQ